MSGISTFKHDIERIGICDGTPIQVTKIASDHVGVAIHHQDDSGGVPNTITWWHEIDCGIVVVASLYLKPTAISYINGQPHQRNVGFGPTDAQLMEVATNER